ncbi:hypothetical protein ABB37_01638 [Leptomonas pyrrhocoris]|uniref:SANT and BTB domain-containing protein n=1 Tax=Leptomonas pyrrhocoris TaxID=157538 RepID=A0A0M9G956_LEPPY|nr:hypothetical protein ABB37_01638 [Leptomonas pyrrhocoris]XP_015663743.1 hypothetical protein ABB37_01638 [Leptomonas pyrrhocoris]KPA85303.1 hypothetical protein ABB37_01638 [Leptomonas pyrrhocoris]KPA85304.1 hypothetical protein ABB37_01638 [Leptomonas pyrrhocoris]|eukprot:XP_015663742.1 hypothetical protein ABB37_01638 [Leptomonas pyrrhocoris]
MSSLSTASQPSSHGRMVEIAVQDPETVQERVFRCALEPLRSHMRFFEPIIAKQMSEVKTAAAASPSGTTPPLKLRAKCDHRTFEWLLDWMNGKAPAMTMRNIVSVTLSSHFLQMQALAEESLLYLRTNLSTIVSSHIDLMALPVDLVLRLSRMVQDGDLAAVLQRLYDSKTSTHPNRAFVATVLQHYVYYLLGLEGEGDDGDDGAGGPRSDNATPASDKNAAETHDTANACSGEAGLHLRSSSGLRWCRLCAMLVDQAEIQRLTRVFQLSAPECPAQTAMESGSAPSTSNISPSPSSFREGAAANNNGSRTSKGNGRNHSRTKDVAKGAGKPPTIRYVGPRGEVFTTHAESRRALPVVLEAPPLLKYDPAATAAATTAAMMQLERWAWRIIGAIRYVSCRRCFHLVPLVEVSTHHCSNLPHKFASPDNVAGDVDHLVRWFTYCAEQRVYAEEGGLTPLLFNGPRRVLAEEVVEVRVGAPSESALLPSKSVKNGGSGSDGIVNGNGARSTAAAERGGKDVASWPSIAGAASNQPMSFWASQPFYVAEVMDKGIVDIDIQNYVERQHRFQVEAQQRKTSALFNPPHMRLASSPMAGQGASMPAQSPQFVSSVSGASSSGSLNRGKANLKPRSMRGGVRSPYGF